MMTPTVSVVVATRDRPEMLRRALASIAASTYQGTVETIVVFDQSAPDPSLARPQGRRPVRVITNDRTPGLAGARNTGALAATGELVALCDDDDEWLPGKLDAQVEALGAHPGSDVVTTGIFVEAHGRVTARVLDRGTISFDDLLRSRVMEAHPSTYLVRRHGLLGRIGLVDEDIPGSYGEDYEWLLRAARQADVVSVPIPLVTVHWHPTSYFADRWRTIVEALDYVMEAHPEIGANAKGRARIESQQAFAHAALGQPQPARRLALTALRRDRTQRRAYVALFASLGLVSTDRVLRLAHARGRGI